MDIDVRKRSDVQVIKMRGDLKIGEAVDKLREALEELLADGNARYLLDITEVPMIDSSGIGVIVRALTSAKQRGGSVKLLNPSRLAMQTLKIVGLLGLFEVYNDEAEAIGSFS